MVLPRGIPPLVLLATTGTLILAYILAVYTRQPIPDWKREQDRELAREGVLIPAGAFGFPSWYGRGGSPYDFGVEDTGRELSVVFVLGGLGLGVLTADLAHDDLAYPAALHTLEVLRSWPGMNVTSLEAGETLETLESCPNIIWSVGSSTEWLKESKRHCPDSVTISDSLGASGPPKGDITLVSAPQDLLSSEASFAQMAKAGGDDWKMGLLAHVLPGANARTFAPGGFRRRVTYFPRLGTPMDQWPQFGAYIIAIPSKLPKEGTPEKLRKAWAKHEKKLAKAMRTGGVCVFEGWQNGTLDIRIPQAMLSGCLVATVPTHVQHKELADLVIPLKAESGVPVTQINEVLNDMSDSEVKRMLLAAFVYARQNFSEEKRVESVLSVYDRFLEGARGYMFPHQFRWTCESEGEKPAWCK